MVSEQILHLPPDSHGECGEQGHACPAKVTSYRVGGKTGTAETPEEKGGYDGNTPLAGVAPIENPQFLVAVTMQRPEGSVGGNGTIG